MNLKINYLYLFFLFTACTVQQKEPFSFEPPVFPKTRQVQVVHLFSNFLFGDPTKMVDLRSHLMVRDFMEERYFHIFEKETGVFIKSFANYGRGPGEFLTYPGMEVSNYLGMLYTYEGANGQNRFRSYKVAEILQKEQLYPIVETAPSFTIKEGDQYTGAVLNFLAWKDKRLFIRNRNYRFEVQDTLGDVRCLYDQYPSSAMPPDVDSSALRWAYSRDAVLALKPDLSKFVTTSKIGCILEVFDIDESGQIEKAAEKRFFPPIYRDVKYNISYIERETIIGISALFATDDYIYAKYEARRYIEGDMDRSLHKRIALFDWEGSPVCLYVLDWEILCFTIDSQVNLCYIVGVDANEEIQLGYFAL